MQRPMQSKASNPSTPPQTSSSNWEQEDQSLTPVLHYTQTYKHHHKWSISEGKADSERGKKVKIQEHMRWTMRCQFKY